MFNKHAHDQRGVCGTVCFVPELERWVAGRCLYRQRSFCSYSTTAQEEKKADTFNQTIAP